MLCLLILGLGIRFETKLVIEKLEYDQFGEMTNATRVFRSLFIQVKEKFDLDHAI